MNRMRPTRVKKMTTWLRRIWKTRKTENLERKKNTYVQRVGDRMEKFKEEEDQ